MRHCATSLSGLVSAAKAHATSPDLLCRRSVCRCYNDACSTFCAAARERASRGCRGTAGCFASSVWRGRERYRSGAPRLLLGWRWRRVVPCVPHQHRQRRVAPARLPRGAFQPFSSAASGQPCSACARPKSARVGTPTVLSLLRPATPAGAGGRHCGCRRRQDSWAASRVPRAGALPRLPLARSR